MNVQVYHCPDFKPPTHSQQRDSSQNEVRLNRLRPITVHLSPGRLVADLFGLAKATSVDRKHVTKILTDRSKPLPGATWDQKLGRWKVPAIHVVLVGHFLAADLTRVFGRDFNDQLLLQSVRGQADVKLVEHRKLGFATTGESFGANGPILDYIQVGKQLLAIRVQTCDLRFLFGRGSLESLCKTYLGCGKSEVLSAAEKSALITRGDCISHYFPRTSHACSLSDQSRIVLA